MIPQLFVIINIFLVEVMLSLDNVAVLALLVAHLPSNQQKKALRYGILGAFLFRGLSLFLASWLIKFWFLKLLGGGYLLYLTYDFFKKEDNDEPRKSRTSSFWATVLLVEALDMVFSVDNIFAASAISSNLTIILIGVFVGIMAIRFVAGWFITLMERYPNLETSAFVVIGLLGFKLVALGFIAGGSDIQIPESFDIYFSASMLIIFLATAAHAVAKPQL